MPINCETIKQDLEHLTHQQLQEVADFIAFLKFRHKRRLKVLDPQKLATLATEFAKEDCELAEAGMGDYAALLQQED